MDINMESVGARIKNRRNEIHLTQTDIFNMCGIRSGALSRIENGTSVPSVILFYRIAQILECDMQWLLTGDSPNMEIPIFSQNEEKLLEGFRELSKAEQEELLGILTLKQQKEKRQAETTTKSSKLTETNSDVMVG